MNSLHRGDGLVDDAAAFGGCGGGFAAGEYGVLSVLRDFGNGGGHFFHGGGDHLHLTGLVLGTSGRLGRAGGDFVGRAGQHFGAAGDRSEDVAHGLDGGVDGGGKLADLVGGSDLEGLGEVLIGDLTQQHGSAHEGGCDHAGKSPSGKDTEQDHGSDDGEDQAELRTVESRGMSCGSRRPFVVEGDIECDLSEQSAKALAAFRRGEGLGDEGLSGVGGLEDAVRGLEISRKGLLNLLVQGTFLVR